MPAPVTFKQTSLLLMSAIRRTPSLRLDAVVSLLVVRMHETLWEGWDEEDQRARSTVEGDSLRSLHACSPVRCLFVPLQGTLSALMEEVFAETKQMAEEALDDVGRSGATEELVAHNEEPLISKGEEVGGRSRSGQQKPDMETLKEQNERGEADEDGDRGKPQEITFEGGSGQGGRNGGGTTEEPVGPATGEEGELMVLPYQPEPFLEQNPA